MVLILVQPTLRPHVAEMSLELIRMKFDRAFFVFTESIKQDQSNSLDVNNSKDLKGLVTHGVDNDADDNNADDHESKATAAAPITQSTQNPSSKRHSDIDMAKTMPSMAAVMPSKEAVVTGEEAVNNESFPQATSGDKNWQQSQLSSALEDITPQDVPSISAQGKVNNIERVCVVTSF